MRSSSRVPGARNATATSRTSPTPAIDHAIRGESPSPTPAAATISGDGVSPAASAAASGSPPGSAAATAWPRPAAAPGPSRGSAGSRARPPGRCPRRRRTARWRDLACLWRQLGQRRGVERAPAREELVEHEAERVDVALDRRAPARRAARAPCRPACPRRLVAPPSLAGRAREAEVGDARAAAAVDHDVGGLQVAVQHARARAPPRGPAQIWRAISIALSGRQAADPPQQRGEVLAVDVLHRQEVRGRRPRRCRRRGRRSDARPGARSRTSLRKRASSRRVRSATAARQELQRDRLAELQVVGAIDLAHAAAPEEADDAVALGDDGSRREAFPVERVGGGQPADDGGDGLAPRGRRDRRRRETRRQLRNRRERLPAPRAGGRTILDLRGAVGTAGSRGGFYAPRGWDASSLLTASSTCPRPTSSRPSRPPTSPT